MSVSVAKAVREGFGTAFYFSKDTLNAIAIPVFFVPESERVITTGILKRRETIEEKHAFVEVMFLDEFQHEIFRCIVVSRWMKLGVKHVVSIWIDSHVQPVPVPVQ